VEDLYIDWQVRDVHFLVMGTGGFLGIGKKRLLVPVEACVEVAEDRFTIEPGRIEKLDGPALRHKGSAPSCRRAARRHEVGLVSIKAVIDLL
jgi:hypothetical protein